MKTAFLFEWKHINPEQFQAASQALGWVDRIAAGLAVELTGPGSCTVVAIEVWDSAEAFELYRRSRFSQTLQRVGLPEPRIQSWLIPSTANPA